MTTKENVAIESPQKIHFFNRIVFRLLVPYFLVSIATLALFAILIYYNYSTQREAIQKNQEEIALKSSAEIDYYIQDIFNGLSLTRRDITCIECADEATHRTLQNFIDENPSVYEVTVITATGKEKDKIVRIDDEVTALNDKGESEVFQEVMKGKKYISPIYVSKYGLPFMSVGLPIFDQDNIQIGALATEVDLSPMWNTVSKIKVGSTGYVYVVDREGNLVAYRDVNLVKMRPNLTSVVGVKNFLNTASISEIYTSFTGEKVIGSSQPIKTTGWGLIIELPYQEVLDTFRPLIIVAGISFLVFVSFIVLMLIIVFRRLISPIRRLRMGVMGVGSGNLDHTIDVHSDDEIGDLAIAFNGMTTRLRDYYNTLEQKVSDRTKELQSAQGDLKIQLEELEKMNKLMVNRELKMIEMKDELASLRKKTGLDA
ncbi:MAG: cache domain-containing protein [Candidatus Moraniibacteriota bacterium]